MCRCHPASRYCSRNFFLFQIGNSKSFSAHPRICVKGKRVNHRIAYGLEIPAEYTFYGYEKAIQWAKRTLDAVDENVKKSF